MSTKEPPVKSRRAPELARSQVQAEALQRAVVENLARMQARFPDIATPHDWYMALAYTVRDRLLARWIETTRTHISREVKVACYLSAEFLIGPQLGNNLVNLGIEPDAREAMRALGQDLDQLAGLEEEPGLGNGGLGRLAACYIDSLATLQVPALGYGIRYEFGIFDQVIEDGRQVEITDKWLQKGNPWELQHPEIFFYVNFGGWTETYSDQGHSRVRWIPADHVKGIACDTPVLGYRVNTCNTLRLWKSEATESFDFQDFNIGDYYGAVEKKTISETLSKVLYPNDEPEIGKRLRLAQQYFFVSCSLQDMLRLLDLKRKPIEEFPDLFAVQLNDTHPSIAVAELMRLLVDERSVPWDLAWDITQRAIAYTNHTLLPEALETWGVPLFQSLLPRPLEIIYEINRRFLDELRERYPGDDARVARMSLIDEAGEKRVRMAHLATVGSHAINGVAGLHSTLLRQTVLRDFAERWPDRFCNVTNGVTPRRFMVLSNPSLTGLLNQTIGDDGWVTDLPRLKVLEARSTDKAFQEHWRNVKRLNKETLGHLIRERTGTVVDPEALFDIQVKRIHEYKRQHLNVLHIITLYLRLRDNPGLAVTPRCFIFGGKAAPGYHMAKLMIRLINGVADVVNSDPAVGGRLKVVFFPDFNVKNAHAIYPAADLSEQISTAGKEASGTGNMKFTLNGALTIGTLDGANVEIREDVGADNFFLFGLTIEDVNQLRAAGYRPRDRYEQDVELRAAVDLIASGAFAGGDTALFRPLVDHLLDHDTFLLLADYRAYVDAQAEVDRVFRDRDRWARMSILNVARAGRFSSDRSIGEYCDRIWQIKPVPISVE